MKYAQRRDNNEPELIRLAKRLGWRCWQVQVPRNADDLACDWIGLRRGVWRTIEIKNPDCQGHADEYTALERMFIAEAHKYGGEVLIWRTVEDVMRDSQARQTA